MKEGKSNWKKERVNKRRKKQMKEGKSKWKKERVNERKSKWKKEGANKTYLKEYVLCILLFMENFSCIPWTHRKLLHPLRFLCIRDAGCTPSSISALL